jgi:hypothetical protein
MIERLEQQKRLTRNLAKLLPGITAIAVARAIIHWMNRFAETQNYYMTIVQTSADIQDRFKCEGKCIPLHELFLCIVAYFTNDRMQSLKWPGMGFALGSEFLRNLHWNGFKPDRHIKRLLSRWTIGQISVDQAIGTLRSIIGRKDRRFWTI